MNMDINELSRIGFGSARASTVAPEHAEALAYALRSGCTLIDTSPTYSNGDAEEAIGRVLAAHPDLDAFVVTRAGRVDPRDAALPDDIRDAARAAADGTYCTLRPDVLRRQIESSLRRLQRPCLDVLLLDHPERCLEAPGMSLDDLYTDIDRAFAVLEEAVDAGLVRYFGIATDALHRGDVPWGGFALQRLVLAAERCSADHHFRFIRFPFNLIETSALQPHRGERSLLELAGTFELRTIGVRPINAWHDGRAVDLSNLTEAVGVCTLEVGRQVFDECVELVRMQISRSGFDDDPMEFTPMRVLRDHWMCINTPRTVMGIFLARLYPFLNELYQGVIPAADAAVFTRLQYYAVLYSMKTMIDRAVPFQRIMRQYGGAEVSHSLAHIVCGQYLGSGVDHVVVGMTGRSCVDDLKTLFANVEDEQPDESEVGHDR